MMRGEDYQRIVAAREGANTAKDAQKAEDEVPSLSLSLSLSLSPRARVCVCKHVSARVSLSVPWWSQLDEKEGMEEIQLTTDGEAHYSYG